MTKRMTPRHVAILTGTAILLMAVVAGIIMEGIFTPIFNMSPTEFQSNAVGFRTNLGVGIAGWFLILMTDLIASWGLFRYYSHKNYRKSAIMGLLRLAYSLILLVAIIQLVKSYITLGSTTPDYTTAQRLLDSFESIWQFGLIIFGLHLIYLAPLVCNKQPLHMILAALLLIAGIGYLGSNLADIFIDNYEEIRPQIEVYLIPPMVLGELGLAIWLLVKGGKKIEPN